MLLSKMVSECSGPFLAVYYYLSMIKQTQLNRVSS
jgi:hypothetical protein